LDKYWVVSLFVQHSTRHVSRTRLVLTLAPAAVILLLFLCSARASAEGTDAVAKFVAPAEEAAASGQAPPSPEPVAPVAEDDPEPVQAEHEVTTDATPEAVVREATAPAPSSNPPEPLSTRPSNSTPATPAATIDAVADQVPNLTRRVSPDPAETTAAVIQSAETAAKTIAPAGSPDHLNALPHHLDSTLNGAVGVLQAFLESQDLIAPDSVKSMLSPAEGPSEVVFGAPPGAIPAAPGLPPAHSHLGG